LNEYERLITKFTNRIFIHNSEENLKNIKINNKLNKFDWSPFYKNMLNYTDTDIIIKCDDDILFIDIISLKYAIIDRINDKVSFIIHSNCINNGLCGCLF
jgi:hypothetical protein